MECAENEGKCSRCTCVRSHDVKIEITILLLFFSLSDFVLDWKKHSVKPADLKTRSPYLIWELELSRIDEAVISSSCGAW